MGRAIEGGRGGDVTATRAKDAQNGLARRFEKANYLKVTSEPGKSGGLPRKSRGTSAKRKSGICTMPNRALLT